MTATTLSGVLLSGVAGSRPAANAVAAGTLYAATDTHLITQSDGASTWSTWINAAGTGLTNPMTTTGDIIYSSDNSGTPARRAVGSATQVLHGGTTPGWSALVVADLPIDSILPWHVSLIPMVWTPDATTGTWALAAFGDSGGIIFPFVGDASGTSDGATALFNSSTAQNDAVAWDVVLAAGTWDAHFWVRQSTNTGIITLNQDGASAGTVDTYAASAAAAKVSITGFTVATTGKKRMQVKAATKNGSSSGYILELFAIEFRRTA